MNSKVLAHAVFSNRKSCTRMITLAVNFLVLCMVSQVHAQSIRKFDYVGGDISSHPRLEKIPGRQFLDFGDQPVDAVPFLASNGFNAVRAFVHYGQPLVSDQVDNSNANSQEANFSLDFGGVDWQVQLAQRCRAQGMKVLLTIHFGQNGPVDNWHEYIPQEWLNLTYQQTVAKIDSETRKMLKPFLDAGIQPDVIIVENEADAGMLYQYLGADGTMQIRQNDSTDVFSDVATGIYSIWPKCAGYFKRVILSAKDAIAQAGYDNINTRFSVHTTGNPFRARTTYNRIFDNKPDAEQVYYDSKGVGHGVVEAVPADIRNQNLRDLVDIMGFSMYPDAPTSNSASAFDSSLAQFSSDMNYMQPKIQSYGRFNSGPFAGQYKKQVLVVEFGVGQIPGETEMAFADEFFRRLSGYEFALGAMWWEPTYGHNNWYGSQGSLYRTTEFNNSTQTYARLRPISTLRLWGYHSKAAGVVPPVLSTTALSDSGSNGKNSGGRIFYDGGAPVTQRGVCWSLHPAPTIADNITNDGTGTGSFTSYVSNLLNDTTYYVRSYATNSAGTSYGDMATFRVVQPNLLLNATLKGGFASWQTSGTASMFKTQDWSPTTGYRSFGNNYWIWTIPVKGRVMQTVSNLKDGKYEFSCQWNGTQTPGPYSRAAMVVIDGRGVETKKTVVLPSTWTTIRMTVTVRGGKATVGLEIQDTSRSQFWWAASVFDFHFVKDLSSPAVNITSPADPSTFVRGSDIAIEANANDTDGTIRRVEFYNGNTKLGEDSTAPYSFNWKNVGLGSYSIKATALDNDSLFTSSAPVSISVVQPLQLATQKSDVNCLGGNNGSISVSISGGTPPYEVRQGESTQFGGTTVIFNNLHAGVFYIFARDANGFEARDTVTITSMHHRPTASLSGDALICPGSSAELKITSSGSGAIHGILSDGSVFTGTSPQISLNVEPAVNTLYTIQSLADEFCDAADSDLHGSATVSIAAPLLVSIPDGKALNYPGVAINTVYPAYAPASSINLSASVTGGSGAISFKWSNGDTTGKATCRPDSANTLYYVTVKDELGCIGTASKLIAVQNVSCGNGKIKVCHIPPGNTDHDVSICIGASAVLSHLQLGCVLGDCAQVNSSQLKLGPPSYSTSQELKVNVLPNPTNNVFTAIIRSDTRELITWKVIDLAGRVIEKGNSYGGTVLFGSSYTNGVYFLEVRQGPSIAKLTLIKKE